MTDPQAPRRRWFLRAAGQDWIIVLGRDLRVEDEPIPFSPALAAQLERWFTQDSTRAILIDIFAALGGSAGGRRMSAAEIRRVVRTRLEQAFRAREVVAILSPLVGPSFDLHEQDEKSAEPAPAPQPGPSRSKTWIEIELVDENGKPVRERYAMELPDGRKIEGRLDANGRARVDNIDEGMCEVWFPDRDASEWRRG